MMHWKVVLYLLSLVSEEVRQGAMHGNYTRPSTQRLQGQGGPETQTYASSNLRECGGTTFCL